MTNGLEKAAREVLVWGNNVVFTYRNREYRVVREDSTNYDVYVHTNGYMDTEIVGRFEA